MPHLLSHAISLIVNIFLWIYDNFGINAILIIILAIELPVVSFFCKDVTDNYQTENNYKITTHSDLTKTEYSEVEAYISSYNTDEDDLHYNLSIEVSNYYFQGLNYPNLSGKTADGNIATISPKEYYGDIEDYDLRPWKTVIPAGASGTVNYVVSVDESYSDITSPITIHPTGELESTTNQFTVPFAD